MKKIYLNTIEEITKVLSEGNVVYDCHNNRKHKIVNNIMTESDSDNDEYVYINYGFGFEPNRYYIEKKEPIKIEVGKFYRNKNDDKVICVFYNPEMSGIREYKISIIGRNRNYYVDKAGDACLECEDIIDYWED